MPKTTDVHMRGAGVIEIDAEPIAKVIFEHCPNASRNEAIVAANAIIDHLIEVLRHMKELPHE